MVEAVFPIIQPQLDKPTATKVSKTLEKKFGLTKAQIKKALSNKKNYLITYIIEYDVVPGAAGAQGAVREDVSPSSSSTLRERRNRVSLRNLTPGAGYAISYQVETRLKQPKLLIGTSKKSPATTFKAPSN